MKERKAERVMRNQKAQAPDNTYIFDTENSAEMARLINQDQFITRTMGGPLAGLPGLPARAQVLDLGCGPGGWVLDTAFALPDANVAGIDISKSMIAYANTRASSQDRINASLGIMDITTSPLDFSDASFDLVNARFLMGVLKRENWEPFIRECTRVLRLGGILRLTEADMMGSTLSPTIARLNNLAMNALWQAGYGFSPDGHSFAMTSGLLQLLKYVGYRDLQIASFVIDYSLDSTVWTDCYRNIELVFLQMKPLLIQYNLLTSDEFDQLYEQAMQSMASDPYFVGIGQVNSIWVRKNE